MTQYLPPNLLALFAPRDPLKYLPPTDKLPWEKSQATPYSGVAQFIQSFEDPKDTPPPTRVETRDERKERKRKERAEQVAYKLEQDLALWIPGSGLAATSDPFKTLFVTRVNFDTSESKLRREFEVYGPIRKLHLVINSQSGKPRGYAFVEYEHERDMHSAYKHADGKKIDGRRVLVDVERGRTIKGWRPRRLGGGLGGTRKGGPDVNTKYSGREDNYRNRERDERSASRNRSRSRSPRRRRRSRSPRERKPRRSRSPRRRSRERNQRPEEEEGARKRSRRSRSRERKRSRSPRDRKRSRRSRSRERKPDRDRRMEEMAANQNDAGDSMLEATQIKAEPVKAGYDKYMVEEGEPPGEGEEQQQGNGEQYNNGDNSYQEQPQEEQMYE